MVAIVTLATSARAQSLSTPASAMHLVYSTHDWQNANAVNDQWADVKQPGDGRRYLVGTTTANPVAAANPLFSNETCNTPGFPFQTDPGARQVAVLQVTNETGDTIDQAYFYGWTNGSLLQTFARAIAVYPGTTSLDTRIVICGDTFDTQLPLAATPAFYQSAGSQGAGFLAVYNGDCDLLWSYHFYGEDATSRTAVTDVAIHFDQTTQEDVITYCGCSTNGAFDDIAPGSLHISTMTPLAPFLAPADSGPGGCNHHTAGDTHNAADAQTAAVEHDGFVGRIRCSHVTHAPSGVSRDFHSIVGGMHREGLFGITLLDDEEFAVVGTLDLGATIVHPGLMDNIFPLTRPYVGLASTIPCLQSATSGTYGVALLFDSSTVTSTNALRLVASTLIGSDGTMSVARDVCFQGKRLFVVGSTEDAQLAYRIGNGYSLSFLPQFGQHTGYILGTGDLNNGFEMASFAGWTDSHLGGVSGWAAYPDHVCFVGWGRRDSTSPSDDLLLASAWVDGSGPSALLKELHTLAIESNGEERADASEGQAISACSFLNGDFLILDERDAGGGIACDAKGRITVAGSNRASVDYPAPRPTPGPGRTPQSGHGAATQEPDAIVSVVDLLPQGVARTDGSGYPQAFWTIASGDGGTTPLCGLTGSGGPIERMLIDYEGAPPAAGVAAAILVDRPPLPAYSILGAIQFGFPDTNPSYPLDPGVEVWVTGSTSPGTLLALAPTSQTLRLPMGAFPSGSQQFTVQFSCLLTSPVCTTTNPVNWVASPGMLLWY